jgi:TRAP-type C4-dicarboxylate transport system permease small subunit
MINKILDKVSNWFTAGASVVIVITGLMTILNILLRTIFNAPISGAVEMVQVGMLTANAFALGRAGYLDRHIAVPQFVDWLPKRIGSTFRTITNFLGLVTFGYVTFTYFKLIPEMAATGRTTDVLKVPVFIIYIIMAICFLLATFMFLYWTVFHFKRILHPVEDKPKEGLEAIDPRDMIV